MSFAVNTYGELEPLLFVNIGKEDAERLESWRREYRFWRRQGSKGANGEISNTVSRVPAPLRKRDSLRPVATMGVLSQAEDVKPMAAAASAKQLRSPKSDGDLVSLACAGSPRFYKSPGADTIIFQLHNLDCSGANAVPLNLLTYMSCQSPATGFVVHSPMPGPMADVFLKAGALVVVGQSVDDLLRQIPSIRAVICNSILSAHVVTQLADRGVPCLWVLHEWWPGKQLEEECLKRNNKSVTPAIVQDAMTRCGRIVCVCESQKRLYSPKAPSRVAYVGVPDPRDQGSHNSGAEIEAAMLKRPFTFLTLGIVCPRKNQHFAVKLFKQLCERTGASETELRLIVVGVRREREYERQYAELVITEIDNDPRIEIHDVTKDTSAFYRRADALLFPSLNEVTPCVIAEAMSYSLPVVATDIAGIPEMVCNGVEGFLADPDDSELFVEQMQLLYRNPTLCKKIGSAGRAKFESKFSMQSMVRTFQSIIAEVAPPRTVLVDMDGCLVDWDRGFSAAWANRSAINRKASYAMESCVPPELKEEACAVFHEQGFFAGLPPMEGGLRALNEMRDAGLNVLLCTAPVLTSRYCAAEKFGWVENHLGPDWLARIVLTTDKTVVKGDVLIDDKPRISGSQTEPEWQQIIFDAPYNADTSHSLRLSRWADWRGALVTALHQPL